MSTLLSRTRLKYRCSIERNNATTDEWGQSGTPDWSELDDDLPCYAWVDGGREAVTTERTAVVRDMRLLLPLGTDVTESDRIGDISERGSVIFDGPFGIEVVLRHRDHLELMLTKVA